VTEPIDWSAVDGLGVLRDEVVAERLSVAPTDVREARKRLGIGRKTGPTGWRRRLDVIARDPSAASVSDVMFLVECIREVRRRADAARKAAEPSRLRVELRAARCVIWVLYSGEEAEALSGAPSDVYEETVEAFTNASQSWWTRKAIEAGEDLSWAERNAEYDPAPPDFIDWVMDTGKMDEHAAKCRVRRLRDAVRDGS